jgi:phage-related protein
MNTVGPGVREIRIHAAGAFRVIFVAKFGQAVYVLHAFETKRRKTTEKDISLARRRYQIVVRIQA